MAKEQPTLDTRRPTQAVIFDLDGVLVSSIPIHYEAFRRTFAPEGVDFTFDDYMALGAGAARDVLIRRVMGDISDAKLALLMDTKVRHVEVCITELGLPPIDGAVAFVEAVRTRGMKTAVATASRTPHLLLRGAGLIDLFDVIVDRDQVDRPKPYPDVFLAAARALGVSPDACLVIEDSPVGVEAGLNARMRVIALTTSESATRLSRAHGIYGGFAEIDLDAWLGPPPKRPE